METEQEQQTWISFWAHACRPPLIPMWFLLFWYIYIMGFYGANEGGVWGTAIGIMFIVGFMLTGNMYHAPFEKVTQYLLFFFFSMNEASKTKKK